MLYLSMIITFFSKLLYMQEILALYICFHWDLFHILLLPPEVKAVVRFVLFVIE